MADDNPYLTLPPVAPVGASPPPPDDGPGDDNPYRTMPTDIPPAASPFEYDPKSGDSPSPFVNKTISKIKDAGSAALNQLNESFNPSSDTNRNNIQRQLDPNATLADRASAEWDRFKNVGAGIAAVPGLIGAPVTGAARATIGTVWDAVAPPLTDEEKAAYTKNGIPLPPTGDQVADTAMMGLRPTVRGAGPFKTPAVPVPPPPPTGPLGVTLSEGQATQSLPLIQREQAALRGQLGAPAEARAKAFATQQAAEVGAARETAGQGLDPAQQMIAENPQQAGQLVSQSIQSAKTSAKAGVDSLYENARSLPGEIHAGVFENIGSQIKNDLTHPPAGQQPVIIDEGTKAASNAIKYLDDRVSSLKITNKADPFGQPNPANIVGVNLAGVDQWRKMLSGYRDQAFGNGQLSDGRAMQAIMNAFDSHIDKAVNSSAFTGDPMAAQAWNNARAAHSAYRSNYFDQGTGDAVGKAMEKITGGKYNGPATPNDVADQIYGASGTNPNTANVGLANRVKDILGPQSPEWSGVKQGLFSRLIEPPAIGMPPLSSAQIYKRITDFLGGNGKELADAALTPADKQLFKQYADLHKSMIVPQAGANWSNTGTSKVFSKISDGIGMAVGAAIARTVAPATPPLVSETLGAGIANQLGKVGKYMDARAVAKQMPLVTEQLAKWQKAVAAANKSNSPVSRAGAGFATANLSRSLQPFGIDLRNLFGAAGATAQGPGTSNADENQPDVPGEPSQQKYGGKVETKSGFAHGGRVNSHAINHSPTEAQKEAGNYAKDHVRIHGLNIAIENAKGSMRRGVSKEGKPWETKMPAHYGYIKGTVGADKDHVDVYLGPHHRAQHVYVVDQTDSDTGDFDEHKAFIGFATIPYALKTFHSAFSDGNGHKRLGNVTKMPMDHFKQWLSSGKTKKPLAPR